MTDVMAPPPSRSRRSRVAVVAVIALVAVMAALVLSLLRPVDAADHEPRTILVPPGASAREIGQRLVDAGLIRHSLIVVVLSRALRVADGLRHGEYAFAPAQGAVEIVRGIASGESIQHRVTIPEGYTARQIVDAIADAGLGDRARLAELVAVGASRMAWGGLAPPPDGRLEGYLFPDTYAFTRGLGEVEILQRLVNRFVEQATPAVGEGAGRLGLSMHQILTVASMIERETKVPDERAVVAAVIYNRLKKHMPLQIDATVLYALGRHKSVVGLHDLEVDSPYNTYRRTGLPPGPISSPGRASIEAAVKPADAPYLYYVLKPDGSHHFSRTLEEHHDAVRRFRP
jgi:peptidoglycan lytic transglycosylase G